MADRCDIAELRELFLFAEISGPQLESTPPAARFITSLPLCVPDDRP
jgi:hypothetical protein